MPDKPRARNRALPALILALCAGQAGCASVPARPASERAAPDPLPADATGAGSAEELATALDETCKNSNLAGLIALLRPDERADVAASWLAPASMPCLMALALSGASETPGGLSLSMQNAPGMQEGCKRMAEIATRHGSPLELWQSVMIAESEEEQKARWTRARRSLDGADVAALMRELQDAQRVTQGQVTMEFPGFGSGVESGALNIEGGSARVAIRASTGFFALRRAGERWFVSLEHSEPGQSDEQAAAQRIAQATAADQKALEDAMHGSWSGPWGRLEFGADGAAVFETRSHCASEPERPWLAKPGSCKPLREEGKVELSPYEIGVTKDGGNTSLYGAYVDSAGRLHVGTSMADVGKLDAQRQGKAQVTMFRTLHVQGDRCRLEDSMKNTNEPVGCAFVKEDGVDLLRIDAAIGDDESPNWLVYLPDQGLLVSPELYVTAYGRVADGAK
jgi:hypothetical protein